MCNYNQNVLVSEAGECVPRHFHNKRSHKMGSLVNPPLTQKST